MNNVGELLWFYFIKKNRSLVSLFYEWTCQKLSTTGKSGVFSVCLMTRRQGPVPGERGYSCTVATWSEAICLQWNEAEKLERSAWTGTDWKTQRAGKAGRGCHPWEHIKDYIMHSLPHEMVGGHGTMATDVMASWPRGWLECEFEFEFC